MSLSGGHEHRQALSRGQVLHGRYELLDVLGVGGFGVTYLGRDSELERRVAIKEYFPNEFAVREVTTVHPKSVADREDLEWGLDRFLDEARTLARFRHPNLVRVIDYFRGNGTAYIVMDYEDGEPLDEVLDRLGRLSESQLLKVLLPIVDGLREVHEAGFLHRDIKPSNVFIRRGDESPVLLDFGAARHALGRKSNSLTAIVSAGYSPQEQYESGGAEGVWTDIYALSALCYRAIAGEVPVEAPRRASQLVQGSRDPQSRLTEGTWDGFSRPLLEAVDRGLNMVARERPKSLEEWRSLLGGESTESGRLASSSKSDPAVPGEQVPPAWDRVLSVPVSTTRARSAHTSAKTWWLIGASAFVVVFTLAGLLLWGPRLVGKPVSDPALDPAGEPVSETASAPVSERVSDPALDPAGEPVSEAASAPVSEPVSGPASGPVSETVSDVAPDPVRGLVPEPVPVPIPEAAPDVTHLDRVEARSTDVYELTFLGGKEATVVVDGDGDTDLDLYVADESGNQVCVDDDLTDLMICSWTPARTAEFQVAIRNLGHVYNEYTLSASNSSGGFVKTVIATHVDSVQAGSTDVYALMFVGGEEATVLVDGDGDTDLDLYVADESGNQVCVDDDLTDLMICSWTPARTAEFQVAIRNLGNVYNEYTLSTSNSLGAFAKTVIEDVGGTDGVLGGFVTHVDSVQAGSTDVYELTFVGGEEASVLVEGDGDTDLDLYVLDESGNQVCVDDDFTDLMSCSWTPVATGSFRIEVRNLGDVYNEYSLRTNGRTAP